MKIEKEYFVIATKPVVNPPSMDYVTGTKIYTRSDTILFLARNNNEYYFSDNIEEALRCKNRKTAEITIKDVALTINTTVENLEYMMLKVNNTYEF